MSNITNTNKNNKLLLTQNVFNFFFKKEDGRCLSNFWECLIVIQDNDNGETREYNSGESCFHGEKFIRLGKLCENKDRKMDLINYGCRFLKETGIKNGAIIKKMGRGFILNQNELDLWYDLSIEVQKEICKYKYKNYQEIKYELGKNKDKILIHPAMRCSEEKIINRLWEGKGVVINGKIDVIGRNMLGKIWMSIRDSIYDDDDNNDNEDK